MDVDKILLFSSTLGWHSLNVNGEVQTRKGLRWIPRHPETRKGVASDEMLRGVENKHRSGDSRIGQPFELLLNPWAGKRQPGELKHLSSQRKRIKKHLTLSCILHLARGDIAQLVELRSCNWVVAITGWMSNCPGGNDSILYLNRWLTFSK
ncbi:hypothetical protein C4D60_Mb00t17770 [Musa balbisiana]|uniref:Uncharacterized protein n=1 Tax=Musa balbisiana TaxID=52838 RepID=A0A4S8I3U5_MUSBA|nr:hypothetical protein C4D60_Mb00t17770 [Musa balbisiana]